MQLTKKEKDQKIVNKYGFSTAEESIILLLYNNGTYSYNTLTNIIGKQFSKGTWKRKGNLLELNSTYGANRLPLNIRNVQEIEKPSRIGIQKVLNLKGQLIENAIIAINNDSIKCSTIMDTCIGSLQKIEKIKVVLSEGKCYSKWIKISSINPKVFDIIIPLMIDFDKYLAFNNRKYIFSKEGLKQVNN